MKWNPGSLCKVHEIKLKVQKKPTPSNLHISPPSDASVMRASVSTQVNNLVPSGLRATGPLVCRGAITRDFLNLRRRYGFWQCPYSSRSNVRGFDRHSASPVCSLDEILDGGDAISMFASHVIRYISSRLPLTVLQHQLYHVE